MWYGGSSVLSEHWLHSAWVIRVYRLGVFINDKEGIVAGPEKGKLQNKR